MTGVLEMSWNSGERERMMSEIEMQRRGWKGGGGLKVS